MVDPSKNQLYIIVVGILDSREQREFRLMETGHWPPIIENRIKMTDFPKQVAALLSTKSTQELAVFVSKLAERTPPEEQAEFLMLLENKQVIIVAVNDDGFDKDGVLERISTLLDNVEEYDVEAHYYESYEWDGPDGYDIESDDGFSDEYFTCYNNAIRLLEHGCFDEAARAFAMLLEIIDKFNLHNENSDYGAIYFDILIEEGNLAVDVDKIRLLVGYSALMSPTKARDDVLKSILDIFRRPYNKLMFQDVLRAGSRPLPDQDAVLVDWVALLKKQAPSFASKYIKEAAAMSDDLVIMEAFVGASGKKEPLAYIHLLELYIGQNVALDVIIETAVKGLKNTNAAANNRARLATILAESAKEVKNEGCYRYAVSERFFSDATLRHFLPLLECGEPEMTRSAMKHIDAQAMPHSLDYCLIHFLQKDYNLVFEAFANDKKALGWSSSLKGVLIPLFIGLLCGFDGRALMTQKLIERKISSYVDTALFYGLLRENIGDISPEQHERWHDRCTKELGKRSDAIVSGKFRGSYYKVAELLVAMGEIQLYQHEDDSFALLSLYSAKYPRHNAFRREIRAALDEAGLGVRVRA